MIKSLKITNHIGETIELELMRPEKSGFIVTSIDGLGPAKATVNTTNMATADGSVFNSSRIGNRNIVLSMLFMETNTESIEDIRQKSYRYFPSKKAIKICIRTDNREVETVGYVESNEPDIFSRNEGCEISIICPDPHLYSSRLTETVFSGTESLFEFPFENNSLEEPLLEMGKIIYKTEHYIHYDGDSDIGVSINIHVIDHASNLTILNSTRGEKMVINMEFVAGDNIVINSQTGNKSITLLRDGVHLNILNYVQKGSAWFTLQKGDNVFAYSAEIGTENLQFYVTNKVAYIGV